jgi:hypothetical protein
MKKITIQRIMAIFIGVVMLASVAEIALLRNTPAETQQTTLPNIVNRKLTLLEMRDTLTGGKVLIEYFYNETCTNCTAKENVYKEFVNSEQFKDYVVLSYGVWNETADWMLDAAGTQKELGNISSAADMKKLLCSDEIRMLDKPNVCVLEGL